MTIAHSFLFIRRFDFFRRTCLGDEVRPVANLPRKTRRILKISHCVHQKVNLLRNKSLTDAFDNQGLWYLRSLEFNLPLLWSLCFFFFFLFFFILMANSFKTLLIPLNCPSTLSRKPFSLLLLPLATLSLCATRIFSLLKAYSSGMVLLCLAPLAFLFLSHSSNY